MRVPKIHRATTALSVSLLLAAMLLQAVLSMRLLSATTDETTHLPSGYSYLETGDLRLNPQHPPLIKLLAAVALLPARPQLNLQDPAWTASPPDEWAFGYRFLYSQDADRLLFLGRMPIVLLGLLLAFYVFRWARDLFGNAAGFTALVLCVFSPTVIAHSRFVTFDVALACFSTIALYHLWRHLRDGRRSDLILAGLGLGLALASKFSATILLVVFVLLLGIWVVDGRPADRDRSRSQRLRRAAIAAASMLALALLVIQASYLFSGDPLIYWKGLAQVNRDHDPDFAYYLMGEFRKGGWWYYFIVAFLVKTPLPTLILIGLSVVLVRRLPAPRRIDELFLALPVVLHVVITSALADNLGVRYLLPIYPLMFVFASRLAQTVRDRRAAAIGAVLLVWYVAAAIRIYPDHLAYFNEAVGGPRQGHRYLDDSNIDWSQDLKRLKGVMDRRGIDSIKLRYGPNISPDYYGIRAQPILDAEWASPSPPPGIYAIGTHLLIRGEYYAQDGRYHTNWLTHHKPTARIGYSIYLFEFD